MEENLRLIAAAAAVVMTADLASAAAPSGPSFDCARASSAIEKAICADGDATARDRDLAKLYSKTMAGLPGDAERTALRDSQRAWMKQRDATCQSPPPPTTIGVCLREIYAKRWTALHGWGLPRLTSSMMADDALAAAYGPHRSEQNVIAAAFSPDGALLAFTTGAGDWGETVWLYDVAGRRLFAATPVLTKQSAATIERFYWVGQTLYGEGQYGPVGGPSQPLRFAATKVGGRRVDALPPAPVTPGEARDTTDAGANGGERQEEDAHFVVASVNNGHGAFSLTAAEKTAHGREWTLQTGGWELARYLFDAPRDRVLYNGVDGLVIYGLAAHKAVNFVSSAATILAVSPDGAKAALAVRGACDTGMPADGPVHICLTQLP